MFVALRKNGVKNEDSEFRINAKTGTGSFIPSMYMIVGLTKGFLIFSHSLDLHYMKNQIKLKSKMRTHFGRPQSSSDLPYSTPNE